MGKCKVTEAAVQSCSQEITLWHGCSFSSEAATGAVLQKEGVLRNYAKFTGKHLCQSLFFNKVAGQSLFFNIVAGPDLQLY